MLGSGSALDLDARLGCEVRGGLTSGGAASFRAWCDAAQPRLLTRPFK
jgi:hypothetical protein